MKKMLCSNHQKIKILLTFLFISAFFSGFCTISNDNLDNNIDTKKNLNPNTLNEIEIINVPAISSENIVIDGRNDEWDDLPISPSYYEFCFYGDALGHGNWGSIFTQLLLFHDQNYLYFYIILNDITQDLDTFQYFSLNIFIDLDNSSSNEKILSINCAGDDFRTYNYPCNVKFRTDVIYPSLEICAFPLDSENFKIGNTYRIMFQYTDVQTDKTESDTWPLFVDGGSSPDDSHGDYSNYVLMYLEPDRDIKSPSNLYVNPDEYTSINNFDLYWDNPWDFSGIIGAFYKIGVAPSANEDGVYVEGENINSILGIYAPYEGEFDVFLWLKDNLGNVDYSKAQSVRIYYDPTSPESPVNISWEEGDFSSYSTITANWNDVVDVSPILNYIIQLDIVGGDFSNPMSEKETLNDTSTITFTELDGLENGFSYIYRVKAVNAAGLSGQYSSISPNITIDRNPPSFSNPTTPSGIIYDDESLPVYVGVTDETMVSYVFLDYSIIFNSEVEYHQILMENIGDDVYKGIIPNYAVGNQIHYRFRAIDKFLQVGIFPNTMNYSYTVAQHQSIDDEFLSVTVTSGIHKTGDEILFTAQPKSSNVLVNVSFDTITLALNDDGVNGDELAGDNIFSRKYSIPMDLYVDDIFSVVFQTNESHFDNSLSLSIDTIIPECSLYLTKKTELEIYDILMGSVIVDELDCSVRLKIFNITGWEILSESIQKRFDFSHEVMLSYQGNYRIQAEITDKAGNVKILEDIIMIDNINARVIINDIFLEDCRIVGKLNRDQGEKLLITIKNYNSSKIGRNLQIKIRFSDPDIDTIMLTKTFSALETKVIEVVFYPKKFGSLVIDIEMFYNNHYINEDTVNSINSPVSIGINEYFTILIASSGLIGLITAILDEKEVIKIFKNEKTKKIVTTFAVSATLISAIWEIISIFI